MWPSVWSATVLCGKLWKTLGKNVSPNIYYREIDGHTSYVFHIVYLISYESDFFLEFLR